MKRLLFTLTTLLILTACSEKEDVFYTARYGVERVEIGIGLTSETDEYDDLRAQITANALSEAPVEAGGCYRLDFSRFDGGELYIYPTAEAEPLVGTFTKSPAATEITFHYDERETLVTTAPYIAENGIQYTVLKTDLTEYYRTMMQTEIIQSVVRLEYTNYLYY
ncbi:MAG: lipoprotein [Rikenellaceae bacterium]|nr:lipoprotein [Rikenellaceae bacterium]